MMALALLLMALQSQDAGETIVTAPRSAATVTTTRADMVVVKGEDLVRTGERSLPRALGRAAGVWIQESNLGGGSPVIRGLLGNQILILIDGVRLNDSTTRLGPNESLNSIDPAIIERVEVYHGTASVLYGSDAIGGVIAIWTRSRPPASRTGTSDRELHAGYRLEYDSSVDGGRASLDLSGAGAQTGLLGILSGWRFDDLEVGGGDEFPSTGYQGHGSFGSWEQALDSERSLRLSLMSHRDFEVPRTFNLVPGYGQTESSHVLYDFKLLDRRRYVLTYDDRSDGPFADRMQVRVSRRDYQEQRERQRRGSSNLVFEQYDVRTTGLGADWEKSLSEGHLLSWGFDYDHDDVDSFSVTTNTGSGVSTRDVGPFAPDARYDAFGLFVQDQITSFDPYDLTVGLRYSFFDFAFDDPDDGGRENGDFDALTASVAAARDLGEGLRLNASLAQGFQAPNLEDLANDGDFAGGTEIANPDLDPARSLMAEVGLELARERWQGGFALFATRIEDSLGRRLLDEGDPDVSGDETYLRENVGRLDLYGLELAAEHVLFSAESPWRVASNVAYVRGRQYDDTIDPNTGEKPLDGVEARRIPPWNGLVALRWEGGERLRAVDRVELGWRWAASQHHLHPDDASDPRIDPNGTKSWDVVSLDVSGPLGRGVRYGVGLHNLFDEQYRVHGSGVDGPGRALVLTLDASF